MDGPAGGGREGCSAGADGSLDAALPRDFRAPVGSVILCRRGTEGDGAEVAVKRVTIGFVDRTKQAEDGLSDIDANRGGREASICHALKKASGGRYIVQLLGARGDPPGAQESGRALSRQNQLPGQCRPITALAPVPAADDFLTYEDAMSTRRRRGPGSGPADKGSPRVFISRNLVRPAARSFSAAQRCLGICRPIDALCAGV